jgi:hypothetical protein
MGKMPLSHEEVNKIIDLRKTGYSVPEIQRIVLRGKTTVFNYVRNIKLSHKYQEILNKKKRSGSANRKLKNLDIAKVAAQKILNGPHREMAIIIAMLYWAEGTKRVCSFINSDGKMIAVYLRVLREVLDLSYKDVNIIMRIFDGMDRDKCLEYWSAVTGIHKRYFIVRFNDGGTKCKVPYGMLRIVVKKGDSTLKFIQSIYSLISEEILTKNAPVVQRIRTNSS